MGDTTFLVFGLVLVALVALSSVDSDCVPLQEESSLRTGRTRSRTKKSHKISGGGHNRLPLAPLY